LLLKSPTTTDDDRSSADELSGIAEISIPEFGEEMLSSITVLRNADPDQVVESDFKCYREKHISLGIGQVEVMFLDDIDEASPRLFECLEKVLIKHRLDWALLLVTNVVDERSVLLLTEYPDAEKNLVYRKISNCLYDLPGVLSRKKQLLTELLRVSALAAESNTLR
jgi:manganese-dependent inorganic pyrophosphatase